MKNNSFITFPIFNEFPELFCAFSTRMDGHSKNTYSGLHMGLTSGDNVDVVRKNRKHWFESLNTD